MKRLSIFLTALMACILSFAETTKLSNADIAKAYDDGKTSYRDITLTDSNGFVYTANAICSQHSKKTSEYKFLQIKSGYSISIPEMPGAIQKIVMTVSNASKPMTDGGNTTTLSFVTTDNDATTALASGTGANSITLDMSSNTTINNGYINASGAIRIWDIEITYVSGDPISVENVVLDATAEVTVGNSITLVPTFEPTNATNKNVTWKSDNEEIAVVANGVITGIAEGTANITVTTEDGNKMATCAVTVTPAPKYELVTDVATLANGMQIIITNNDATKALGMDYGNNRKAVDIIAVNGVIAPSVDVEIIKLIQIEDNWAFQVEGGYLYAASSSSNYLKTRETNEDANGQWSITIDETGNAVVNALGTNTRNWMRYNNSSALFACYTSGQQGISIYKKQVLAQIKWVLNGGKVDEEVILPEFVSEEYTLPIPIKEGYAFLGWFDNEECEGTALTFIPAGWTGTLYASWKKDSSTSIDTTTVTTTSVKKIIRNGQVLIIREGKAYDVVGQVVE